MPDFNEQTERIKKAAESMVMQLEQTTLLSAPECITAAVAAVLALSDTAGMSREKLLELFTRACSTPVDKSTVS